jgi:hypothetical protein
VQLLLYTYDPVGNITEIELAILAVITYTCDNRKLWEWLGASSRLTSIS